MQQPFLRIPRNVSGRDFAVGDVHGHFSRLRQSLDRLGFDPALDRLFSVGDLVDRGPENEQVLDWLRQPGSTRCKAITGTTRSTTSAAARWTR